MTGHQSQYRPIKAKKPISRKWCSVIIFVRIFIIMMRSTFSGKKVFEALTNRMHFLVLLFRFWFFWRMRDSRISDIADFIREKLELLLVMAFTSLPLSRNIYTMHIRKSNGKTKFVQFYGEKHCSFYELWEYRCFDLLLNRKISFCVNFQAV